jgi:large subunit ribosomal protein L25
MAQKFELSAELRTDVGKGASRRLRRAGEKVPGIVYGGGEAPVSITLNARTLAKATESDTFFSQILSLRIGGAASQVIARDVQSHPLTERAMHIDFQRIVEGQEITVDIPLHFLNEAECYGVKTERGIITHHMIEVEVTCLPRNLPEYIEIDMTPLKVGDAIHLSDLKLPEGVVIEALEGLDEEERAEQDVVVVSVGESTMAAEMEALEQADEAAAPISPEVATVKEDEDEGAESSKED